MASRSWKSLLLPPLFALALYVFISYILVPVWQRLVQYYRRNHDTLQPLARYAPLGDPSSSQAFQDLVSRVSTLVGRSRSGSTEAEGFLGDEELEDGNLFHNSGELRAVDTAGGLQTGPEAPSPARRLSRDLEGGFMDDSDEHSDDGDARRIHL